MNYRAVAVFLKDRDNGERPTVLIGGGLGMAFGAQLPERVRETVLNGLGLFTIAIGLQMTLQSKNMLIVLGSVLVERLRHGVACLLCRADDGSRLDQRRAEGRYSTVPVEPRDHIREHLLFPDLVVNLVPHAVVKFERFVGAGDALEESLRPFKADDFVVAAVQEEHG